MSVLLDTHVWLRWQLPDPAMPDDERRALDGIARKQGLCLPAIGLWEAQMLCAKGRVELPAPFSTWLRRAVAPEILTMLPLDVEVVAAVDALPDSFHGDPADRLIVATARAHGLPLATHDRTIRKSRLVRLWSA